MRMLFVLKHGFQVKTGSPGKKLLEFFTFVRVPLMKRRQDMYFKKIIKKEREQEFSMKLAKLLKYSILVIGITIAIQVNLINKDKGLR